MSGGAGSIKENLILWKEKERKEERQILKSYLLLLSLHWVIDYLERWYGVYCHLDKANEMKNIDITEWQKS